MAKINYTIKLTKGRWNYDYTKYIISEYWLGSNNYVTEGLICNDNPAFMPILFSSKKAAQEYINNIPFIFSSEKYEILPA